MRLMKSVALEVNNWDVKIAVEKNHFALFPYPAWKIVVLKGNWKDKKIWLLNLTYDKDGKKY